MKIKVMGNEERQTLFFDCQHFIRTDKTADGKPGPVVEIELALQSGEIVSLPRDGDVAYVMNDKGDTIDTVKWEAP